MGSARAAKVALSWSAGTLRAAAQALLDHDLIDELRLMVYPVILGTGKRLFGDPGEKKTLRLVDSKVVGDGVVILTYAPSPPA